MKINRLNLIRDMNKVLPGIATGTVILENADTVVFNNGHLYSYNSSVSVDATVPYLSELKGMVKGMDFYNCLSKLPGDDIDMEIADSALVISAGKIKLRIKLLPEGNVFERFDSLAPSGEWIDIDGDDFRKSLSICNMPKNNSKYAGIHFRDGIVLSTDGYALNRVMSKNKYPVCWIDNRAVAELMKWDDFVGMQLNKAWLQLKSSDGMVFSVRTLDASSCPYDSVFEVLQYGVEASPIMTGKFTEEFYQAAERASLLSGEAEGHQVIELSVGPEGSVVSSERMSGSYEEDIPGIVSDVPIKLKLDTQMVIGCRKYFSDFKIIERRENKNVVLEEGGSMKMFSAIR